jgi:hypothetical protein
VASWNLRILKKYRLIGKQLFFSTGLSGNNYLILCVSSFFPLSKDRDCFGGRFRSRVPKNRFRRKGDL